MKLVVCVFIFFLSGCSKNIQIYQGYASFGPEVQSFVPCSSESEYWLSVDETDFPEFFKKYRGLVKDIYDPVYVEFEGEEVSKDDSAVLLEDYAHVLHMTNLLKMKNSNSQCN
jgi:hypothetical protein